MKKTARSIKVHTENGRGGIEKMGRLVSADVKVYHKITASKKEILEQEVQEQAAQSMKLCSL